MRFVIVISLVVLFLAGSVNPLKARITDDPPKQDEKKLEDWQKGTVEEKNHFPYMKEKYEMTLNVPFEDVWNACKKGIDEENCMIIVEKPRTNDTSGLYLGKIVSDYCIFAQGDTTDQNLKYFSFDMPFIRGAVWANGRIQYKFFLKENDDRTVYISVAGEISGLENLVTKKVHFWKSNGYLESMMMEKIKRIAETPKK